MMLKINKVEAAGWFPWAVALATVVVAAFHAFPQTDDFCTFGRLWWLRAGDPVAETWHLYMHWTGRYASSLLIAMGGWTIAALPLAEHLSYQLLVLLGIGAMVCSIRVVLGASPLTGSRWALAVAVAIVVVLVMPSRLEGVYWWTGAAVYTHGVLLFLLLAVAIDGHSLQLAHSRHLRGGVLLGVFLIAGFNEMLAGSFMIYLAARLGVDRLSGASRWHIAHILVFTIGLAAAALAPGNFARDALSDAVRHDLVVAGKIAFDALATFGRHELRPDLPLLAILMLASILAGARSGGGWSWQKTMVRLGPLLITLLSALPLHAFAYGFLVGEAVPGRVVNQAYLMMVVGIALVGVMAGARVAGVWDALGKARGYPLAFCALGVLVLTSGAYRDFAHAVRHDAPAWSAEQLARAEILGRSQSAMVELAPLTRRPSLVGTLQGGDITEDPAYWVNGCLASYARVQSVISRDP